MVMRAVCGIVSLLLPAPILVALILPIPEEANEEMEEEKEQGHAPGRARTSSEARVVRGQVTGRNGCTSQYV